MSAVYYSLTGSGEQPVATLVYPEDIAKLALSLAEDESSMITLQQFVIDEGRL